MRESACIIPLCWYVWRDADCSQTSTLVRPFGCEIVIEDHDLHHRHGWRESYYYGKQSLLWDALFGTKGDRLETRAENIDWDARVK